MNAIMRKFLDNPNNSSNFIGRPQTLNIHVQEKLHIYISQRGAGVQENDKPPTAARLPGGWLRENFILILQSWFSRRISRPTQNHGGNGRKRRTRRRLYPMQKRQRKRAGFPALTTQFPDFPQLFLYKWDTFL